MPRILILWWVPTLFRTTEEVLKNFRMYTFAFKQVLGIPRFSYRHFNELHLGF